MPISSTEVTLGPVLDTPSLSNDGRYVAYLRANQGFGPQQLHVQDLQTGRNTEIYLPPMANTSRVESIKLSGDGSKLAFACSDRDTGSFQVYVANVRTGQFQLANSDAHGVLGNGGSAWTPNLSDDGNMIAFTSWASNLVEGDTNGRGDVFVKNLQTGAVTLVSKNNANGLGNEVSFQAQISGDGHSVLFKSHADNLAPSIDLHLNFLVKDLLTNEVHVAAQPYFGTFNKTADNQLDMAFSADGSRVAYERTQDFVGIVEVKDVRTGSLVNAFSDAQGKAIPNGQSTLLGISSDGRYVTFSGSQATPHSAGLIHLPNADGSVSVGGIGGESGPAPVTAIYQKDLQTGALTMLTSNQLVANASLVEAISADAQHLLTGGQSSRLLFTEPNHSLVTLPIIEVHLNGGASIGNDALLGDTGPDQLAGGKGDDTYLINHQADQVRELADAGRDTVVSQLRDYQMPDYVENLRLNNEVNSATPLALNGSGNALNNLLIGNDADNALFGWDGNDVLLGYQGKNRLDGGNGFDTVSYVAPNSSRYELPTSVSQSANLSFSAQELADFTISKIAGGIHVSAKNGSINDSLYNIERIAFSDQAYALSGDLEAAQAYRLYQAAFNRAPDKAGLGYWISQIEHGLTLEQAAQNFMQSNEFKAMYGLDISHRAFVEKMYQNVLHRAGEAEGVYFWSGLLEHQQSTPAQVLASFAESAENQAALVGVMEAGFAFTPFVG